MDLDLLDEYLANRYQQVLKATDWIGLKAHGTLQTQAAYQSGTDSVTFTVGSADVTGSGTTWTNAISGQRMYRPGDSVIYTVTYVSSTALTLDRPYEGNGMDAAGTVYTGAPYVFMQHIYALPSDAKLPVTLLDPVTGFPLSQFSKEQLDASAGPRTLVNDPTSYAIYDDSAEASPPVLHQVELFPPPIHARGIPLEYLRNPNVFDGQNTTASPLPWVSDQVLLYGCRADIAGYKAGQAADGGNAGAAAAFVNIARGYETQFAGELARMLREEHAQRRKKVPVQMATRFTRHRMARAGRGLNNTWGPSQGGPL